MNNELFDKAAQRLQEAYRRVAAIERSGTTGRGGPPLTGVAQEILDFLTTGKVPTNKVALREVQQALQGTPWAASPADFFRAAQSQEANKNPRIEGTVPFAEDIPTRRAAGVGNSNPQGGPAPAQPAQSVGQFAMGLVRGADAAGDAGKNAAAAAQAKAQAQAQNKQEGPPVPGMPTLAGGAGTATSKPAEKAASQRKPGDPLNPTQSGIVADPANDYEEQLRLMVLLRDMGLDPTRLSPVGQRAASILNSIVGTLSMLLPFQDGGNGMERDASAIAPLLSQFAKGLVTPGASSFADVRNLANSVGGNDSFLQMLQGMTSPMDSFQALDALMNARSFGLNGMVRQSLSDQSKRAQQLFGLSDFDAGGIGTGTFYDWLNSDEGRGQRGIFGLR